jgi:tRNA (guanine26-N2/guanine27-N2)-dimethyltransferase
MKQVSEGKARLYTDGKVFYNPEMTELRDLSVLFLKAISTRGKRVLDATAATGVRAIRYALEAGAKDVTLLDINGRASRIAEKNVRLNHLKFNVLNLSVQEFANTHRGSFEIIDLDPFGSPSPDVYDVMKLCWDGTVLMITATDTAVLCGAHEAACVKIYGSKPLHNEMCKEVGIRILLNYVSRMASQFNFGIEPLLSVSDRHYMRIFIRLEFGAAKAIGAVKSCGLGTFCRKCYAFRFARGVAPLLGGRCETCGGRLEAFGPLWLGKLYDKSITSRMLGIGGSRLLRGMDQELDVLMLYSVPKITGSLGFGSVSQYGVIERLRGMGRAATTTQFDKDSIKTDASPKEVFRAVKNLRRRQS